LGDVVRVPLVLVVVASVELRNLMIDATKVNEPLPSVKKAQIMIDHCVAYGYQQLTRGRGDIDISPPTARFIAPFHECCPVLAIRW
jgi:hypothetical protein